MAIHEFGAANPRIIYVALRWNDSRIDKTAQAGMPGRIAEQLRWLPRDRVSVRAKDVRVYNLVGPEKDRGMELKPAELGEAKRTLRSIVRRARRSDRLRRIIVGGTSGLMPGVALALKFALPRSRVELRHHHKARRVNALPLDLVRVL